MDLNAIISELQQIFSTVFGEGMVLRTRLDPALELIEGDARKIQSILVSLFMQARDAAYSGTEVFVMTRNLEVDDASAARMSLAPGRYARLDLLVSQRIETEIVREAVEQLKGAITTTPAPEHGVTVTLTLPQVN